MPVSRRRLNAATRMVLAISSVAAAAWKIGDAESEVAHQVEHAEELLEDLLLVLDRLDAWRALERLLHDVVLLGVDELDPEGLRQEVRGDVLDQVRVVAELLLEPLVCVFLRLVEDLVDLRQRPQVDSISSAGPR